MPSMAVFQQYSDYLYKFRLVDGFFAHKKLPFGSRGRSFAFVCSKRWWNFKLLGYWPQSDIIG